MGSVKMLLCLTVLMGLITSSYQQENNQPRFLVRNDDGTGTDGNLRNRLQSVGIFENTPIGTTVGQLSCVDDDVGDTITYGIENIQTLKVSPSGIVTLSRLLDKEADDLIDQSFIGVTFQCWDNGNPQLTATAEIDISVTDRNDNSPAFINGPYEFKVPEDTPVNTMISTSSGMLVRDIDRASNAKVIISCNATSNLCDNVRLQTVQNAEGRYTVFVYLNRQQDFETNAGYTLIFMAKDQSTRDPQLNSTVNVLITVEDTQDTPPQFLNSPLTIYVEENSAVGTRLPTRVSAQDGDRGNPRAIDIRMKDDPQGLFRLGNTTQLPNSNVYYVDVIVNAEIDREQLLGSYSFEVEAVELENGADTNDRTTDTVRVDILDVNDLLPTFSQSVYNVTIFESVSGDTREYQIPLSIQITDRDDPSNAKYVVVIANQTYNSFSVYPFDPVMGNVAVNLRAINSSSLDYDRPALRQQTVILEAREDRPANVSRTSTATVYIYLQDLNDNSPVFTLTEYNFSLPEDAKVGTFITQVQAVDKDEGANGRVTYSLRGTGSEKFNINPTTGNITLADELDYETNKMYRISIIAQDSGNPPRETSKDLNISVTDVNDEAPIPVYTSYQTRARETELTLSPNVIVQATDNENPDSVITYRIIAGNTADGAFQIDRLSGELTLVKFLDFDTTPNRQGFFNVVIQASDNGNPPQYVNITVRVSVQDENNNDPVFERLNYDAAIGELASPGTSVIQVTATDMDQGENGRIRYTIQSGGREHFDINEKDGFISVSSKAQLDFNEFPSYRMILYAIDYGSPPRTGTATLAVRIEDANNKPPEFTQQIHVVSISEASPIGTSVLEVRAIDPDRFPDVRYSIPPSTVQIRNSGGTVIFRENSLEYRDAFVVGPPNGTIYTNRTLSRDYAAQVSFNVIAEDFNAENKQTLRQTATTSVLVIILGTNVSRIQFTPAPNYFSVTEGKKKGYTITTVSARDPTCLENCPVITYREVNNTDALGYLEVDPVTGRVSLSQEIDYEIARARRLYMEIEAIASDGRRAYTKITVEVRDDNDNSPKFRLNRYDFSIREDRKYPFTVGYVQASDEDSGSFGRVAYSISGQGASDFEIFRTGLILVSQTAVLDYETTKEYTLLVTASDNPTNETSTVRRQTTIPLIIHIVDVNDNTPQFAPIYPFYVVENFRIGQSVGRIIATDGDTGTNGEIVYSMPGMKSNSLFRITDTGYILTRLSLRDMSPLSPFYVTVRAQDKGVPFRYNETQVEINVRSGQLDDGRPQWSRPRLGVPQYINESTPVEQFVIQAVASARSATTDVIYSFNSEGDDYKKFKIDPVTGIVTTNGTFDREEQATYNLILIATDRSNTTLQSYRRLTVIVRDENDNLPDFGSCPGVSLEVPQRASVLENVPIDTFVYRVKACDLDEVINGVVYRVETDNPMCVREMAGNYFKVSSDGNITTNKLLDRETKQYHLVCVRAAPLNRRKRQVDGFNRTEMTNTGQIAYVVIRLIDINDNGPKFLVKELYEVISSVPTERTVVRVTAVDPDLQPFNRVRYSIQSIVYYESQDEAYPLPGSFMIGSDTGIVSTAFPSYGEFRFKDSYFNITIQAEDFEDPDKKTMINLFVYIFEPSQTIRLVIDKTPDDVRAQAPEIIKELSEADPSSLFKLQQVSYHRVVDQFDVTRTDVCFVVVKNKKVLSVREGSDTLSQSKLNDVLDKYGARTPGSCFKTRSSLDEIDWQPLWWVLVAIAIFIFICCCILIAAICILFGNYKRYMNTRKTYLVPQ